MNKQELQDLKEGLVKYTKWQDSEVAEQTLEEVRVELVEIERMREEMILSDIEE